MLRCTVSQPARMRRRSAFGSAASKRLSAAPCDVGMTPVLPADHSSPYGTILKRARKPRAQGQPLKKLLSPAVWHYRADTRLFSMTTSTRRFCWRPVAELLSATGELMPCPEALNRLE